MAKQKLSLKELMAMKKAEINPTIVNEKANDVLNSIIEADKIEMSESNRGEENPKTETIKLRKNSKKDASLSDAEIISQFSQIKTTELTLESIGSYNALIKEKVRIDRTVNIDKELMKEIKTLKVQLDDKYTNNDLINVILYHGINLLKK